jgi:hypothetical protein
MAEGSPPGAENSKPTERQTLTSPLLREMNRANDYSLDLATYWERGRQSAAAGYEHSQSGLPLVHEL